MSWSPVVAKAVAVSCLLTLFVSGCAESSGSDAWPLELRQRLPDIENLRVPTPSQDDGDGTASGTVASQLRRVATLLGPLDLLQSYLQEGGAIERDVAIVVAIQEPPRAAGPTMRYKREASRLDVESATDHRFFYLQILVSGRFDPDNALSERALLVDGSTVVPNKLGQRASISRATGLARVGRGYLRVQLNRRAAETDPASSAIQLDFDLGAERETLHLIFFARSNPIEQKRPHALWSVHDVESGQRYLYYSESDREQRSYGWLAQQTDEGHLVVWRGNGTLWACYDSAGVELGDDAAPALCQDLIQPFPKPPSGVGWPALPGGLPR
jgi:hypothetical protein